MSKRSAYTALLFATAFLATSCWQTDQNWSACQEKQNLVLRFRVQNVPDSGFDEYIDGVQVFLFDAGGNWIESRQVPRSETGGGRGTSFSLVPGTYQVVCWANVNGNSQMCEMDSDSNLENSFVEIRSNETGDPIYYTPYRAPLVRSATTSDTRADNFGEIYDVRIEPGTVTIREMVFVKVHRKVEIFMGGHPPVSRTTVAGPVVEHAGAGGRFDFLLRRRCPGITLTRPSVQKTVNGESMFTTDIISKLVPITPAEVINIYDPRTGALATTINVERFVKENKITDTSYIPIHIVFGMDASVSVSLPSWMENKMTWR
jgi:hypothetical protein